MIKNCLFFMIYMVLCFDLCGWEHPVWPYSPYYDGRDFDASQHLGEDIEKPEKTAIRSIGSNGRVMKYGPATSYGELVAVIEYDLPRKYAFINRYGNKVETEDILLILGHLRDRVNRDDPVSATGIEEKIPAQEVQSGQIVGYINDDDNNGDGTEHVHCGIRLMDAATAKSADPGYWFRGYDKDGLGMGKDFAALSVVLQVLQKVGMLQSGWKTDGSSQAILDCYNENVDVDKVYQPKDNGNDPFVHAWPNGGEWNDPDVVFLQDYVNKKGDLTSQIVLNGVKEKAFWVHGGIGHYWMTNNGYKDFGPPATGEYEAKYAGGKYGQSGDIFTVQKFSKTGKAPFKTIAWNSVTTGHYPVGFFSVKGPTGALCYVLENGVEKRWPNSQTTVPTDDWLLDKGQYAFILRDPNGNKIESLSHNVIEGNHQLWDVSTSIKTNHPITNKIGNNISKHILIYDIKGRLITKENITNRVSHGVNIIYDPVYSKYRKVLNIKHSQ